MQIRYYQRKMTPFNKCDHKKNSKCSDNKKTQRKSKSDRQIWWFQIFAFHFLLITFQTCFICFFLSYSSSSSFPCLFLLFLLVCWYVVQLKTVNTRSPKRWTDKEDYSKIRMKIYVCILYKAIELPHRITFHSHFSYVIPFDIGFYIFLSSCFISIPFPLQPVL